MNYVLAVAAYLVLYALLARDALEYGAVVSFLLVAASSVPILLVLPRVLRRIVDRVPLLPAPFRAQRRLTYAAGWVLVLLGNLAFYGDVAVGIYLYQQPNANGAPVGIFAGLAMYPYLLGIVLVEVSFRSWSRRQADRDGGYWQIPVFAVVGLILAGHVLTTVFGGFGQR